MCIPSKSVYKIVLACESVFQMMLSQVKIFSMWGNYHVNPESTNNYYLMLLPFFLGFIASTFRKMSIQ
jgi:hypothetical protein